METMLNFETQQVEHDMSSSPHTPPTSSQGGDQQSAVATLQNVERAPPASNQRTMRTGYKHHSHPQIKEMESFNKECPYPNEEQRSELGNLIGLNSSQIKFWFQNKNTQMKTMKERYKNTLLIAENEKLRVENLKYKEAWKKAKCHGCGGLPSVGEMYSKEQLLRLENFQLKEEVHTTNFNGRLRPRPLGFRYEASRESIIVMMNPNNLIEILMDVNKWSTMFSNIVSRARIIEILSTGGARSYDGALQAMSAEFKVLSHLVPTRDNYFIRYCKHHPNGAWAVVDISLDNIRPGAATRCKRRPSGCMIQELENGFSKVTWIEHVEVEDIEVHDLFKHLVNSGYAFGARRWITTLHRQCERIAYIMATSIQPRDHGGIAPEGRKSLMKLAMKVMQSYCNCVGASSPHIWTVQKTSPAGIDDVRIMTRNYTVESGALIGLVISVATSFSLPVPSKRLFDFLRNEKSRNQWDFFTHESQVHELAHIANGCDPRNYVSLLCANSANAKEPSKIIVQENCTDYTGSYVVYAPINLDTMNLVLSGSNPDYGAFLPSGFVILPNKPGLSSEPITNVASGGCLCTVSYQTLIEATSTPLPPDIVSSFCNLMKYTVEKIQAAMMSVNI